VCSHQDGFIPVVFNVHSPLRQHPQRGPVLLLQVQRESRREIWKRTTNFLKYLPCNEIHFLSSSHPPDTSWEFCTVVVGLPPLLDAASGLVAEGAVRLFAGSWAACPCYTLQSRSFSSEYVLYCQINTVFKWRFLWATHRYCFQSKFLYNTGHVLKIINSAGS